MDAKTHTALKESITKWEKNTRIRDIANARTGEDNCPLCYLFYNSACKGCPISEKTNDKFCRETPYGIAEISRLRADAPAFRAASKRMVAFLKSLEPESEGGKPEPDETKDGRRLV